MPAFSDLHQGRPAEETNETRPHRGRSWARKWSSAPLERGVATPSGRVTSACSLQLADLYVPWSFVPHPHRDEVQRRTRERSVALGLLTDDSQIKAFDAFVQCCTHAYPTGDIERVEAASDWCAWLWYLDNTYDDDMEFVKQPGAVERLMAGMLEVWHNGRPPDSPTPLERFTCDLRTRLLALSHGNPSWFARFVSSVTSHLFQGSLPVALNYADRRTPEVADYELIREYDSGVYPCLDVIELVHNCFLPDSTAADPRVQRLRRLTTRVVAFINDLVSYQNEVLRNRNPNNLLNVLMRHRGLDFDGARSTAVEMVNRDVVEFCRLKASLLAGRSATRGPMRAYVTGMKSWMSGSLEWSLGSARYCAPDSPFPELRTES